MEPATDAGGRRKRHRWSNPYGEATCLRCGIERAGSSYSGRVGSASRYYKADANGQRKLIACGPGAYEAPDVPRTTPVCEPIEWPCGRCGEEMVELRGKMCRSCMSFVRRIRNELAEHYDSLEP